ncbi:GTP cyclohydrolase I FolE [bacterium]|nr:GTP cyclohydrolase I FolE [bacterium]
MNKPVDSSPGQDWIDSGRIESAVGEILAAVGENSAREGLRETPQRVARMYGELFAGMHENAGAHLEVQFDENHRELVLFRDVRFYSLCEHHLLPFFGVAHIAYIPGGHITGLSKVVRAFKALSARPQVQERLGSQMADLMMEKLAPLGAAVVVEARHMCMEMRGVRAPGSLITTSALRGAFETRESTRMEFFTLIKGERSAL